MPGRGAGSHACRGTAAGAGGGPPALAVGCWTVGDLHSPLAICCTSVPAAWAPQQAAGSSWRTKPCVPFRNDSAMLRCALCDHRRFQEDRRRSCCSARTRNVRRGATRSQQQCARVQGNEAAICSKLLSVCRNGLSKATVGRGLAPAVALRAVASSRDPETPFTTSWMPLCGGCSHAAFCPRARPGFCRRVSSRAARCALSCSTQ